MYVHYTIISILSLQSYWCNRLVPSILYTREIKEYTDKHITPTSIEEIKTSTNKGRIKSPIKNHKNTILSNYKKYDNLIQLIQSIAVVRNRKPQEVNKRQYCRN